MILLIASFNAPCVPPPLPPLHFPLHLYTNNYTHTGTQTITHTRTHHLSHTLARPACTSETVACSLPTAAAPCVQQCREQCSHSGHMLAHFTCNSSEAHRGPTRGAALCCACLCVCARFCYWPCKQHRCVHWASCEGWAPIWQKMSEIPDEMTVKPHCCCFFCSTVKCFCCAFRCLVVVTGITAQWSLYWFRKLALLVLWSRNYKWNRLIKAESKFEWHWTKKIVLHSWLKGHKTGMCLHQTQIQS